VNDATTASGTEFAIASDVKRNSAADRRQNQQTRLGNRPGLSFGRGLGLGLGLGFGRGFLAFHPGITAAAFLNFVMLLSHISLLCEIDSVLYRHGI
jgi:hypothetical protein